MDSLMFKSSTGIQILSLVFLCGLISQHEADALHTTIPVNVGKYEEKTCNDISQEETRLVYAADAWMIGTTFQVKIVYENITLHVAVAPSVTIHRGFIINVSYGPRYYVFTVDDSTTRCRNVQREEYGAVCLWVGNYHANLANSYIHGCLAVAIKKKTLSFTGFEFGCISTNNVTVNHTNLITHGKSGLTTFFNEASKGYHRILCSKSKHSDATALVVNTPILLCLTTVLLSIRK